MEIGLVAQTLHVPHLITVFILATISSHGVSNANTHFLGQVQKPTLLQFVFLVTLTYATFIKNVTNIDDFVTFFKKCDIPLAL
jgi:predicted histidine transporter YuiF (NhaC family)